MDTLSTIHQHVSAETTRHPHYAHFTEPDAYRYPSEDFEQRTGLKGVSTNYAMPEGKQPVDVFLPLFHLEVQSRVLEKYIGIIEKAGAGSLPVLQAVDDAAQQKFTGFLEKLERLKETGTLEQVERFAVNGYSLRHEAQQTAGLRKLAEKLGGVSAKDLTTALRTVDARLESEVKECYAQLETLNPELNVLTPQIENHQQRWDVVNGVLSRFNIPDIKCFSIDRINGIEARKDPAWVRRQEQAEQAAGMPTYWIPSPSTQRLIIEQAQKRDRAQGQDAASGRGR